MLTFLYRKNGGEVKNVGVDADPWPNRNATYFEVVTDPILPDGADLLLPKIHVAGTIRNATPAEIANFAVAEATDKNLLERDAAKDSLSGSGHGVWRKVLRALVHVLVDEISTIYGGLPRPVVSLTRSGTNATCTTAAAHNLAVNDVVYLHGADVAAWNGQKTVASVPTSTTFTFTQTGNPTTPAVGSITVYPRAGVVPVSRTLAQAQASIEARIDAGTYD